MKLNALLRYGFASLLLLMLVLPLVAWKKPATEIADKIGANISGEIHGAKIADKDMPSDITAGMLVATYVGTSSCTATGHKFELALEALDASGIMFKISNLLDEGDAIKAKLKDGRLSLGKQKMGSYIVTGSAVYMDNPPRLETSIRYDDGVGYCEETGKFIKR